MLIAKATVLGQPVPKGRARSTKSGITYTPTRTVLYEDRVALEVKRAYGDGPPCELPLRLYVGVALKRPKARMRRKDPAGLIPCAKRPDLDNIVKAVTDAIQNAGVIRDDGQIVELIARKNYAEKDGLPRVEIRIETLD